MKNGLIIDSNENKFWYKDDKLHREDGPAVEYANGNKHWFYHSKSIFCNTQEEFEKLLKLKVYW